MSPSTIQQPDPWWMTSVAQKAGLPLSQVREEQMSGLRLVVPASTRQPSSLRQQALLVTLISRVPVTESVPESVMDEVGTHVVVSVVSQGSFIGVLKPLLGGITLSILSTQHCSSTDDRAHHCM